MLALRIDGRQIETAVIETGSLKLTGHRPIAILRRDGVWRSLVSAQRLGR